MARTKERVSLEAALQPGQKPTLKTIAQMSGLAVPTVSRALNDAPDIGQSTKQLVRRIADEIGYVPNRAGVRLRTGRTNVISLVMSTEHDNHTSRLISSVAGGLQGTRYHLNVMPHSPRDDLMKPVKYIVETRSADGVILNQIEPEDPRVAYLMERNFPFATHGRSKWADQHPYYDFDNEAFGTQSMEILAARGRKKVLLIAPPTTQSYSLHMISGLSTMAAKRGVVLEVLQGVTSDDDVHSIFRVIRDALRADPSWDAVAAAGTAAAVATTSACEELGRIIGEDIDIISKDANRFLAIFRSSILTLPEAVGAAGDFLARAVIQAIQHPELPPMQYLEVPPKG